MDRRRTRRLTASKPTQTMKLKILPFVVLIALPLSCVGGCSFWIWLLGADVKQSIEADESYQLAIMRVRDNQEIKAALGQPIQANFWTGSAYEESDGSMRVALSGPKGRATLYVRPNDDEERMIVELGQRRIVLSDKNQ